MAPEPAEGLNNLKTLFFIPPHPCVLHVMVLDILGSVMQIPRHALLGQSTPKPYYTGIDRIPTALNAGEHCYDRNQSKRTHAHGI